MAEFTVRLREYAKVEVGDAMRKKIVATLAWLVYVIRVVYRGNWLTVHSMLEIIGRSEELIRTKRFSKSSICLLLWLKSTLGYQEGRGISGELLNLALKLILMIEQGTLLA